MSTASRGRAPNWDTEALRAGGFVALLTAVPLWIAASWAQSGERWGLSAAFSLGALAGFALGAACAAWIQRLGLPLAHGLVTAIGTYIAAQVVVTTYRLVTGTTVNWFTVMFYVTLAGAAGLIGGFVGLRMRAAGFVPSNQRRFVLDGHEDRRMNGHQGEGSG